MFYHYLWNRIKIFPNSASIFTSLLWCELRRLRPIPTGYWVSDADDDDRPADWWRVADSAATCTRGSWQWCNYVYKHWRLDWALNCRSKLWYEYHSTSINHTTQTIGRNRMKSLWQFHEIERFHTELRDRILYVKGRRVEHFLCRNPASWKIVDV